MEAILRRLDRLTLEEARTTETMTLEVVYDLLKSTKMVLDGAQDLLVGSLCNTRYSPFSSRQEYIDGRYSLYSRCVCLSEFGVAVDDSGS